MIGFNNIEINFHGSLVITVDKDPVAYIKIKKDLTTFQLRVNKEVSQDRSFYLVRDAAKHLLKPLTPEVGVTGSKGGFPGTKGYLKANICTVSQCIPIQPKLDELQANYPTKNDWEYNKMQDQGFVHTIQVPIQNLHAKGYITNEQLSIITNFVLENLNN